MRVLVTGASGFVGGAVVARLAEDARWQVRAAARQPMPHVPDAAEQTLVGDLAPDTDWSHALAGVDTVIHAAGRVHVMRDHAADPLGQFQYVNVGGTLNLARQAALVGVRRFVFLSSVKVNGEGTPPERAYQADDAPNPSDPYAISKLEAEQGLFEVAASTGLEVVIIRPVLVYGPGVKANFRSMMRWLQRGIPLPLGGVRNKRSLVALENLVDLMVTCTTHPAATNQRFLISDGEDLSTPDLLRRLGAALGVPVRLLPVPHALLRAAAVAAGGRKLAQRLCGSLEVDITKTRSLLGWDPPVGIDDALRLTAQHFLREATGA